jgi:hypothetical protein
MKHYPSQRGKDKRMRLPHHLACSTIERRQYGSTYSNITPYKFFNEYN